MTRREVKTVAVNPYDKYKEQSIMTMTPGEMVVRLYEEIINQLNRGIICIEGKDFDGANKALQKAQKILNHLTSTLDYKYDISKGLAQLYDFFKFKIIDGNVKKTSEPLKEILPLVVDLKDTFAQGEKLARMQ